MQNLQIFTKSENIFVTTGLQQSISILVNNQLPNEKTKVLVEQPTCSEILNARTRMNALKKACCKYLNAKIETQIPDTGCFTCIELPKNIHAHSLVNSLELRNIKIATADSSYLPLYKKANCICLNISNVDEKKIEKGIKIISEELDNSSDIGIKNLIKWNG